MGTVLFLLIAEKEPSPYFRIKKSVRLTPNQAPQTLPPQPAQPRHPHVTRKLLLSAAAFLP